MSARPKNSRVRHGMASCGRYGCIRPECRSAYLRTMRESHRGIASGVRATVPAEAAAAYAGRLVHAGMPAHDIAAWSGLAKTTVTNLLAGRYQRIYLDTRDAILALPLPGPGYRPRSEGLLDATAARRRLQALTARGFTLSVLADQAKLTQQTLSLIRSGKRGLVRVTHNKTIADAYERLWDADPLKCGASRSGSVRAAGWARRQGWEPPVGLDDERIADPGYVPEAEAVDGFRQRAEARAADIRHLGNFRVADHEIAARLGVTTEYVRRQLRSSGASAHDDLEREEAA